MDGVGGQQGWHSFINFELPCKELDRFLYQGSVIVHPEVKNWIIEEQNGYIHNATNTRACRAMLCNNAHSSLFKKMLANSNHVLHHLS